MPPSCNSTTEEHVYRIMSGLSNGLGLFDPDIEYKLLASLYFW